MDRPFLYKFWGTRLIIEVSKKAAPMNRATPNEMMRMGRCMAPAVCLMEDIDGEERTAYAKSESEVGSAVAIITGEDPVSGRCAV